MEFIIRRRESIRYPFLESIFLKESMKMISGSEISETMKYFKSKEKA